jgi:hypothetical protein
LDKWLFLDDSDQVAQALAILATFEEWDKSHRKSLAAFSRLIDLYDIGELKSVLV